MTHEPPDDRAFLSETDRARWGQQLGGIEELEADDVTFAIEVDDDRLSEHLVVHNDLLGRPAPLD